ncbi:DMT family transporter [Hoeflea sp. TYP-13]|uniref:DMT family transporter n=1 Tax=Hoeflea sp. TYP-13 TaxID=3230023 RepID=UPI0034C6DCCE
MSELAVKDSQSRTLTGIALKVASVVVFVGMATCIKLAGEGVPPGQIVFFRSSMAMVPVLAYLAARRQLHTAFKTDNLLSHFWRGLVGVSAMACGFYGLTHLPLPDAIALGYAKPLVMVILASIFLGETIRIYRWSAVMVGFLGVLIISWPLLTIFNGDFWQSTQTLGVMAVLTSAVLAAFAMILVRRLVATEKTPTIVLYFSLSATLLSLASSPFGWVALDTSSLVLLMCAGLFGGIGQIMLTQSYRYAEVSTIAPFEYTSIIMGIVVGYFLFGDIPQWSMLIGTAIVAGAGLFIIVREHRLGLERKSARRFTTPQG